MARSTRHSTAWTLAKRQHGVVSRAQLLELGFSPEAVDHRVERGRLHVVHRGIYAVGRSSLTREGRWTAALLSCGPNAVLSHRSAAALWGIRDDPRRVIDVTIASTRLRTTPGVVVHRRPRLGDEHVTKRHGIRVTTPVVTAIDLAATLDRDEVEQAINHADVKGLASPEQIRRVLGDLPRWPGAATLRTILDRRTFRLSRSKLERRFRPIARRAGVPAPRTCIYVNGFEVDFYWPDLGLVIETDGLTYHRTPQQQAIDRIRDQTHTAAGMTALRFTHAQIRYEPDYVERTLAKVASRLRKSAPR